MHNSGRFFSEVCVTGAHRQSVEALVSGQADVAAVDCVTWALLSRIQPALLSLLRVVQYTPAAPAPPLVTSIHTPAPVVDVLRESLRRWLVDPAGEAARSALLIGGAEVRADAEYTPMLTDAEAAWALGYEELPG